MNLCQIEVIKDKIIVRSEATALIGGGGGEYSCIQILHARLICFEVRWISKEIGQAEL